MNKIRITGIILLLALFLHHTGSGQGVTQTIKGNVKGESSGEAIPYANVVLRNTEPAIGTITDENGNFQLIMIPVGRYDLEISFMGYEPVLLREVLVTSGKEVNLSVALKEARIAIGEVSVRPRVNKEDPVNTMAALGGRMLSVEEAQRYAGGFDDPARLASSFAGVASNLGNNGIVVRGNAPQMLSWRMEGIEIPNPNHFADMSAFGGGGLTALSSQMLANSDFFTGAFPAEYGNATSGVFDIFMRTGNNSKHEHTFQVGGIGIDASSEGPLSQNKRASYLFNYRYSTLALLKPLLPEDAEGTTYQDLAFKLNFPSKRAGVFSFWGLGLSDRSGSKAETDSLDWTYTQDKEESDVIQFMGTLGVSHKIRAGKKSLVKTTLGYTGRGLDYYVDEIDKTLVLQEREKINFYNYNFVLSSSLTHSFGERHRNRSGIVLTGLNYDMLLKNAETAGQDLSTVTDQQGSSALMAAYTGSMFEPTANVKAYLGLYGQVFTLNEDVSIEPRASLVWDYSSNQSIGIAYGKHSRLERFNTYFILDQEGNSMNKDLKMMRAHHFNLNYEWHPGGHLRMKVEPYFQILSGVPVEEGSYFSTINLRDNWFVQSDLENSGEARNYGLDLTLERFLNQGYYFLVTASLFQSEYKGGDDVWRNTRYNRDFLINCLGGKEWYLGSHKQNVLNLNGRISFQGGDHYVPVNYQASGTEGPLIFDEERAFDEALDPTFLLHFSVNYKRNKRKHASTWSFNVINATGVDEFYGFRRNLKTGGIEPEMEAIVIPNISYKIEF